MEIASGPVQDFASIYQTTRRDTYPSQSYDIPPSNFATSTQADSFRSVSSGERPDLPKVGQTRCYWTLLTTSLQFTVLDPVLTYHLQEQAASFLECGLLDFVHPDERESARRDLGNVLAERTLHGSVTRVRYYRLSRIRRLLGYSDSPPPYPSTFPAELIAVDADYMAVYLVVNCVADGVVLCFIHAVVDIAPQADNDERHKTGWSNWCSTYGFDQEQAQALYQRLYEIGMPIRRDIGDPSLRVLQIFRNQPDRPLVLSWPPDSALFQEGFVTSVADSLAQLAQYVRLGYHGGGGGNGDARTSCTRRFKSVQTVKLSTVEGVKIVQVESILIPHGTIIFACHKVNGAYLDINTYSLPSVQNHQPVRFTNVELGEAGSTKFHAQDGLMPSPSQQELASQHYVREWVDHQSRVQVRPESGTWGDPRVAQHPATNAYFGLNFTDSASTHHPSHNTLQVGSQSTDKRSPVSSSSRDSGGQAPLPAADSTTPKSDSAGLLPSTSTLSMSTHVTHENNGGASRSPSGEMETTSLSKERPLKLRTASSSRAQGNPPTGVLSCAHCQITHSPEWRKGPSGKKDLCNACGLRYARSRAKKEGIVSRKRKNNKDKEAPPLSKQPASTSKNSNLQPSSSSSNNNNKNNLATLASHATEAIPQQQHSPHRETVFTDPPSQVAQFRQTTTSGTSGLNHNHDGGLPTPTPTTPFTFVGTSSQNVQIPYYS